MSYWIVVSACVACVVGLQAEPAGSREVAVVFTLTGDAWVTVPPAKEKNPIRLFQWLPEGAQVEVAPSGSLSLAFSSGARSELHGGTLVRLASSGPEVTKGTVRALERVPSLPRLFAIADAQAGVRAGAIRLRLGPDQGIHGLYPHAGATTLPDATVLRFRPVARAIYRVELEDADGHMVFEEKTAVAAVAVPAGILKPGGSYYWRVSTLETVRPALRSGSEFATLSEEGLRERAELRSTLEARVDAPSLALLGEIDRRLGLLVEARDALRAALEKAPEDVALRRALATLEVGLWAGAPTPGLSR